jgi:hypothetical protein
MLWILNGEKEKVVNLLRLPAAHRVGLWSSAMARFLILHNTVPMIIWVQLTVRKVISSIDNVTFGRKAWVTTADKLTVLKSLVDTFKIMEASKEAPVAVFRLLIMKLVAINHSAYQMG